MDQQTIALFIGGLIVTHFATILGALAFGIRHLVKYILLREKFDAALVRLDQVEFDVTQAHDKIRKITPPKK